jgi:hypothetical protein
VLRALINFMTQYSIAAQEPALGDLSNALASISENDEASCRAQNPVKADASRQPTSFKLGHRSGCLLGLNDRTWVERLQQKLERARS